MTLWSNQSTFFFFFGLLKRRLKQVSTKRLWTLNLLCMGESRRWVCPDGHSLPNGRWNWAIEAPPPFFCAGNICLKGVGFYSPSFAQNFEASDHHCWCSQVRAKLLHIFSQTGSAGHLKNGGIETEDPFFRFFQNLHPLLQHKGFFQVFCWPHFLECFGNDAISESNFHLRCNLGIWGWAKFSWKINEAPSPNH